MVPLEELRMIQLVGWLAVAVAIALMLIVFLGKLGWIICIGAVTSFVVACICFLWQLVGVMEEMEYQKFSKNL
jgi:hypothetical protein